LRERVETALVVARHIRETFTGRRPESEVREMIRSALAAIRFDGGNGYFFIADSNGRSILDPANPGLEGHTISEMTDRRGVSVIREMVVMCRRSGEGYLNYLWPKKGAPAKDSFAKVSFCKTFTPLNWVVGTGKYVDDMKAQIQREILEWVAAIRFGEDHKNYIFVVSYDGVTLMNDTQRYLIGRNIWNMSDPRGVKVIQEERRAAERGGDFIHYSWRKPGTSLVVPKVSFVKGVPDWRWMIGAGVHLDNVYRTIEQQRGELVRIQHRRVLLLALVLLLTAIVGYGVAMLAAARLNREFSVFTAFFREAAHGSAPLDSSRLSYAEMVEMGDSANLMITRRNAAEEALLAETERLDITLHSIGEAVITTDCDGRIGLFNGIAEELTSWSAADAAGRPIGEVLVLLNEFSRRPLENPLLRSLEKGEAQKAVHNAFLQPRPPAALRLISFNAAPILDRQKRVIGSIFVFRDITEKRRLDDELNKMQKIESIGLLAGGIAHDFNNLLAAISGNIALARLNSDAGGPSQAFLGKAETALVRAQDLTYQLLTFSKGGNPIQKSLDLEHLVRDVVSFSLHGSKTVCAIDATSGLWPVFIDAGQISQVIQNLIINADQAMPSGGTIHMRLGNAEIDESRFLPLKPGCYVCLSIGDQGIGIPAENMKKVFDPFFTTKEHGNGLGLSVVYSIVRKHGGYIDVVSEVNVGTTFSIYLPAGEEAETVAGGGTGGIRPGSGRILVMDDEPLVLELIGNLLRHLGYEPVLTKDDREALDAYRSFRASASPFAVVIVDLTIPGGRGGRDVAADILAIDPDQTLVVASGYSNDPIMSDYRNYGFRGRLVKPFTIQNLSQVLSAVIPTGSSSTTVPPTLTH
jgi:PAS domain S-box-containing protein